ncbi:MAG: hypothetical protein ACTHM9_01185 [Gemmatimonadales bacterium]
MRRVLLSAASVLLASAAPAAARTPLLTNREAVQFVRTYFVPRAPGLLRDHRATFFSVGSARLQATRRTSRSTVIVAFRIRLRPDAAHAARNWSPIICRGRTRNTERANGSKVGRIAGYRCVTVRR